MVGLLVTTVVLFMRSALLYLVAAFAPIVWSASVSPVIRGAGRRLVHVTVALVLAKLAIMVTLVVGVKLMANAGDPGTGRRASDGAAALGTLMTGFACFAIAGLSPWVVYRLMPTVEGAAVASGIVGGWGRAGMTAAQAGLMVKSLGATAAASAATRSRPVAVRADRSPPAAPATGTSGAGGAARLDARRRQPGSRRSGAAGASRPTGAVAGRHRPVAPVTERSRRCRDPPTTTSEVRDMTDARRRPATGSATPPARGAARAVGAPGDPARRRGRCG